MEDDFEASVPTVPPLLGLDDDGIEDDWDAIEIEGVLPFVVTIGGDGSLC